MVPEGWKTEKLGNYIKLSSGDTKPENIEKEMSTMSPYPVFGGNNVMGFSSSYNSEGSVILIGRVGEYCGVTRYVDQRCWITDNALFTKDISPDLNAEFLVSKLKYLDLSRLRNKGGQPLVSQKPIYGLKLTVPPLPEQKKIAQILSTWDQAITATERLLENSQQRKKALMQQLLTGKKRLPEFEGEWAQVPLGSIFSRVTTRNEGQSTNVVTISGQKGLIRQQEFFKKSVASEVLDGYYLLKKGQFAYNKSYSNGYPMGAIKRLNRYSEGVVTTLYICFELSDSNVADSDFYEQYFESGMMIKGLMQIAHEGGRAHGLLNVKPSDFFSLKLHLPSIKEQKEISFVLCKADEEIEVQKLRLNYLKQEKKALMQQLLTGKRRVHVDSEAA